MDSRNLSADSSSLRASAATARGVPLPAQPSTGDARSEEGGSREGGPRSDTAETEMPSPATRGYQWLGMAPFVLVHLALLGVVWTGVTWQSVVLCIALYGVRMFAVTGGYHRYFSHRTYKTSRFMQFVLAFLAQTTVQKGALWWAAHHRHHHKHSDEPDDVHSPVQRGFWYSHMMWLFDHTEETRWDRIKDFSKYPELVWLNRFHLVPPILLGVACWALAGGAGLVVGFFLSTVLVWHGTFLVNSLAHVIGKRRFDTKDDSRNNWFIALVTLGEGWHNNHHHYQSSTRQGFYWWEVDVTYYVLKAMSWVGLVWDLREPPARVLEEGREADRCRAEGRSSAGVPAPVEAEPAVSRVA